MTINNFATLTREKIVFISALITVWYLLPLTDPDYFWHLKAGEYIYLNRNLPTGDIFSYTFSSKPWVLHEWLFELLLYTVYALFDTAGVKLMTVGFAVSALAVVYKLSKKLTESKFLLFVLIALGFLPFSLGISPRPQLITYLFFSALLYFAFEFKYRQSLKHLVFLPVMMVLWVNAHGGYFIGIVFLLTFTACEWALYVFCKIQDRDAKARLQQFTIIVLSTIMASAINPDGFGHWLYPFEVLGMEANNVISEWKAPGFNDVATRAYLLMVIALLVSYTYANRKRDLTEMMIPICFAASGFISVRHIPLATLTIIPFIALAFPIGSDASLTKYWQNSLLRLRYQRFIGGGKQLGHKEYTLNWVVLSLLIIGLTAYYPTYQIKAAESAKQKLPIDAVNFILANGINGKMFNDYDHGGYLIYRLYPSRKVFIDGRADVYGDNFIKTYIDIYGGTASWKEKFNEIGINYVISRKNAPIRQLLLADRNFKEIYVDKWHSVLAKEPEKNEIVERKIDVPAISKID